ncbi:MAG: methionine adenosyltransferase domain-containing protein [bacterium]
MFTPRTYTVESVTSGHPDKVCDQISDAILDECLKQDPNTRAGIETFGNHGLLVIGGEVTTKADFNAEEIAKKVYKEIGYEKDLNIITGIVKQSPDIAQGVDTGGAGDQGIMYGFATDETPELLPKAVVNVHALAKGLENLRKQGAVAWLKPDGKTQITIENGKIKNVLVSCQHEEGVAQDEIKQFLTEKLIKPIIGDISGVEILVNPTGRFVQGGFEADAGLTGRKIMVDTYGGLITHGGGCFCVAGDSYINTQKGLLQIGEMHKEVARGLLAKTDIHPHLIGNWYNNGIRSVLEVETENGYTIKGTPNHRIRVINIKGNYVWRRLDGIKNGDFVAIHKKDRLFGSELVLSDFSYTYKKGTAEGRKNKFIFPTIFTEDYAYLLGLLIGDGNCMMEGGISVCICEEEQKENVQNLYKRLFGREGKIFGHWAFMGGVEMRAYLEYLGLERKRSWEKKVPWSIFQASKKCMAAFLRGLFDTDGGVRIHGRYDNFLDIKLTSTSLMLIKQVQQLLLNFGIISRIQRTDATGKEFLIEKRKAISRRIVYFLRIKNVEGVRIFKSEIGFNLSRKQKILNLVSLKGKRNYFLIPHQRGRIKNLWGKLIPREHQKDISRIGRFTRSTRGKTTKNLTYEKLRIFLESYKVKLDIEKDFKYLKFLYNFNHFYDRVTKVKPRGLVSTYDLHVPNANTFIANGFICHNSGKDPSKVDRSAAYMCRFAAKNLVASGLAKQCLVSVAYAIGKAEPLMVEAINEKGESLADVVKQKFDFRPKAIIERLNLRQPIYHQTAAYGHFGKSGLPWEEVVDIN